MPRTEQVRSGSSTVRARGPLRALRMLGAACGLLVGARQRVTMLGGAVHGGWVGGRTRREDVALERRCPSWRRRRPHRACPRSLSCPPAECESCVYGIYLLTDPAALWAISWRICAPPPVQISSWRSTTSRTCSSARLRPSSAVSVRVPRPSSAHFDSVSGCERHPSDKTIVPAHQPRAVSSSRDAHRSREPRRTRCATSSAGRAGTYWPLSRVFMRFRGPHPEPAPPSASRAALQPPTPPRSYTAVSLRVWTARISAMARDARARRAFSWTRISSYSGGRTPRNRTPRVSLTSSRGVELRRCDHTRPRPYAAQCGRVPRAVDAHGVAESGSKTGCRPRGDVALARRCRPRRRRAPDGAVVAPRRTLRASCGAIGGDKMWPRFGDFMRLRRARGEKCAPWPELAANCREIEGGHSGDYAGPAAHVCRCAWAV